MTSNLYLGLMSGTSLDGVDAVLADLRVSPQVLAHHFIAFPPALREALAALMQSWPDEIERMGVASVSLADLYAKAVHECLATARVKPSEVRALGVHGQTIRHRPEHGFTLQLNHPARVAELTGIDVVADFRSRDVAARGQGAPLVPAFHAAVFSHPSQWRAVINLGGIANVTILPPGGPNGKVRGWDTGPANTLLDAWCREHTGQPFDQDGAWGQTGRVINPLLARLMAEPYLARAAPKSTGRELFNLTWLAQHLTGDDAPADVQATLLEFTAQSIAHSLAQECPSSPEAVFLCGGGARNAALTLALDRALGVKTQTTDALGVPVDQVEALAFAWLAKRCIDGQSGNVPAVTGAQGERVLGAVYKA